MAFLLVKHDNPCSWREIKELECCLCCSPSLIPHLLNFLFIILMIFRNIIQWKMRLCSLASLLLSFACFCTSWKWYRSACPLLQSDFLTHHVLEFYPRFLCHRSSFFICCCSVAQSCPTLRDPVNCSAPGFSVHHSLPEFAQTQVPWVNNAVQPPHLLSPPFSSYPQIFPASESFPIY